MSVNLNLSTNLNRQPYAVGDSYIRNARFQEGTNGWMLSHGMDGESVVLNVPELQDGCALRLTVNQMRFGGGARTETSEPEPASSSLQEAVALAQSGVNCAESSSVPASAGRTYYAYVACKVERGAAAIALRFYDAAGRELAAAASSEAAAAASPSAGRNAGGGWSTLGTTATAPDGTAALTVELCAGAASGEETSADVSFSDVRVTDKLTALGAQVTNATIHAATLGKDAAGKDTVYLVADGSVNCNARLVAIDVNDGSTTGVWELPDAAGGWAAVTANDGSIYAGSYENALVYRYVPGEASVTVVGTPRFGEKFVYGLVAGEEDEVYGGTYPGALLFRYSPREGFAILGPAPLQPGESYVRDVAYDAEHRAVYAGIGSHASLKRYDVRTGAVVELLPEEFRDEQFVYDINIVTNRMFVRLSPSLRTLVYKLDEDQDGGGLPALVSTIESVQSLGVSPEYEGSVYYAADGVWRYDLDSLRSEKIDISHMMMRDQFVVRLNDQERYPGLTLIGLGPLNGRTRLSKYNATSGSCDNQELAFPEAPTNLVSIVYGADACIYTSGYLVGGKGVYAPMREHASGQRRGVMQAENMLELNGKLYFGVYPGARIFEYDPELPWDADKGGHNPHLLFELKKEEQDRPFGMAAGDGKLYIGTVSGYGKLGGALTVYDPVSGKYEFYRNAVPNQSLITLAYKDGVAYAGSSIWGGIGIEPSEAEAMLLLFHAAARTFETVSLPVPGLKALTALTIAADGNLWGMAEGYLFRFDPAAKTFGYFEEVFPEIRYGERFIWRDVTLLAAMDGYVYGTAMNRYLFRFDPLATRVEVETLRDDGAKLLAEDEYGHLYYVYETELRRFVP